MRAVGTDIGSKELISLGLSSPLSMCGSRGSARLILVLSGDVNMHFMRVLFASAENICMCSICLPIVMCGSEDPTVWNVKVMDL